MQSTPSWVAESSAVYNAIFTDTRVQILIRQGSDLRDHSEVSARKSFNPAKVQLPVDISKIRAFEPTANHNKKVLWLSSFQALDLVFTPQLVSRVARTHSPLRGMRWRKMALGLSTAADGAGSDMHVVLQVSWMSNCQTARAYASTPSGCTAASVCTQSIEPLAFKKQQGTGGGRSVRGTLSLQEDDVFQPRRTFLGLSVTDPTKCSHALHLSILLFQERSGARARKYAQWDPAGVIRTPDVARRGCGCK